MIEGDGIGPEVVAATLEILEAFGAKLKWQRFQAGLAAFEEHGDSLPHA